MGMKGEISGPEGGAMNSAETPHNISSSSEGGAAANGEKMAGYSDDAGVIENNVVDLDLSPVDESKKKGKKKKKRAKKKGDTDIDDSVVTNVVDEEVKKMEPASEEDTVAEETPDRPDNLVLKKLLRGPRYFDPPDTSWGSCFNCGEQGHRTVDCTTVKRKKACYYCGSTEHSFKKCTKGQNCHICKMGGHKAKDCPDKSKSLNNVFSSEKICLKCGDSGHDMFLCKNSYSSEDLKAIQCYVCNVFGHLCCYSSTEHVSKEVSCYKCGSVGHTGLACARLHGETAGSSSPTLCYNCGNEGHFARECPHPLKAQNKSRGEISDRATKSCHSCGKEGHFLRDCPSSLKARSRARTDFRGGKSCRNCGDEGHFARECPISAASNSNPEKMSSRNRKIRFDEDGVATYSQPKRRDGWTSEYPSESPTSPRNALSSRKRGRWATEDPYGSPSHYRKIKNNLASPATPNSWNQSNSGGQSSGSRSYKNYFQQSVALDSPGSYHQRFPASRFYNYSNNSSRGKSNDWW